MSLSKTLNLTPLDQSVSTGTRNAGKVYTDDDMDQVKRAPQNGNESGPFVSRGRWAPGLELCSHVGSLPIHINVFKTTLSYFLITITKAKQVNVCIALRPIRRVNLWYV